MKKTLGLLVAAAFAVSAISTSFAATTNNLGDAEKFLKEKFNLTDATKEFKTVKTQVDELGMKHVRLQQTVSGIPVFGGDYIVHFDKNGKVFASNGNYDTKAKAAKVNATVTAKDAIETAKAAVNYEAAAPTEQLQADTATANLYLYEVNGEFTPCYIANINWLHENTFGNWIVVIDANTGNVVDKIDNIQYTATTGTGTGVLGDTKTIQLDLVSGTYSMKDLTRGALIYTYNCANRTTLPGTLYSKTTSSFTSSTDKALVDAHYYAAVVYDYYKTIHGRNGINNANMTIKSSAHYSTNYVNAFWNGSQMVYGDGDGVQSVALSGGLDVIGHEMSHGVTSYESNLTYANQSGALSESFSDIMGTAIEFWAQASKADWKIGEDIWTPGTAGDALRDMSNPTIYGDPDHMSKYINTTQDNGGVHWNCGIPNHAAYQMCAVNGLAVQDMAKIFYRANCYYWTASTNFASAKTTTLQAAADLFGSGSAQYNAVAAGWTHVGDRKSVV